MKRKVLFAALFMTIFAACLVSCGRREEEATPVVADTQVSQFKTEADLRNALAELGEDAAGLEKAKEYYEELLARDAFSEEDYVALARVYALLEDSAGERRMLWKVLRLYPSEEYARRLGEIVAEKDASMEDAAALVSRLTEDIAEEDAAKLQDLIRSEEWETSMRENGGMIASRVRYRDGEKVVQIVTDSFETEATCLETSGDFLYCRINAAGSMIARAVYDRQAYNGKVNVSYFDAEGNLYKRFDVTLRDNVCVETLTVDYEGTAYVGALNADGTTAEAQEEKAAQAQCVVYAYDANGDGYLYQENTTAADFHMDCLFLGLPYYESWD